MYSWFMPLGTLFILKLQKLHQASLIPGSVLPSIAFGKTQNSSPQNEYYVNHHNFLVSLLLPTILLGKTLSPQNAKLLQRSSNHGSLCNTLNPQNTNPRLTILKSWFLSFFHPPWENLNLQVQNHVKNHHLQLSAKLHKSHSQMEKCNKGTYPAPAAN